MAKTRFSRRPQGPWAKHQGPKIRNRHALRRLAYLNVKQVEQQT